MSKTKKKITIAACLAPVLLFGACYCVLGGVKKHDTVPVPTGHIISAQLIEFSNGDDGSFKIDDSQLGGGDFDRGGRMTNLESTGADSAFTIRDGGDK